MSKLQEQFDALIEKQRALQKEFQASAQELFKETTKEFFDIVPQVKSIHWTQYTPYFNDGEECTFGVNDPYFSNAVGEDLEDITRWGEYDGEKDDIWSEESWALLEYTNNQALRDKLSLTQEQAAAIKRFSKMIQSDDMEPVMRAMFDDHVRVVATRNGFNVEEHDHD